MREAFVDLQREFAPENAADLQLVSGLREPDGAAQVVVVGECERRHAERFGPRDERLGLRGAIEE